MKRRDFLELATRLSGSAALAPSLSGLVACADPTGTGGQGDPPVAGVGEGGYGPLVSRGRELALPEGFSYKVLGREGTRMSDGRLTPRAHDGMAAFGAPSEAIRLVRNHEVRTEPERAEPAGDTTDAYDELAGGGTTTLEVTLNDQGIPILQRDFVSLSGTVANCAGGPTPWNSWLSCEETTRGSRHGWYREHGFVFEVPARADGQVEARPIPAMGRFVHEAVAVDPRTGIVYETEDRPSSGFYRYIPNTRGNLAEGGELEMLAVPDRPELDTSTGMEPNARFPVEWVEIDDPVPDNAARDPLAVFRQGREKGGTMFSRLEGCWFGDESVYFHATNGGDVGRGQVWQYRPGSGDGGELVLVFESPGHEVLDGPDNITVSPTGGILICEDGGGTNFLRGLTPDGRIFDFARNDLSGAEHEFAGATFATLVGSSGHENSRAHFSGSVPHRRVLFVNLQGDKRPDGPGYSSMTFAIWGSWDEGAL